MPEEEKVQVDILLKDGKSIKKFAKLLDRSRSAIRNHKNKHILTPEK